MGAKVSSGFRLWCDPAAGTTYKPINATVDMDLAQVAPEQDATMQVQTTVGATTTIADSLGKRQHLPGLRDRDWTVTLIWDHAHTDAAHFTHNDLLTEFMKGTKMTWRVDYPKTLAADATVQQDTFAGVITALDVNGIL